MDPVSIQIQILRPGVKVPEYQTPEAAGFDLEAGLERAVTVDPGKRELVPTGIAVAIPYGYVLEVRPRSGLAWKSGVTVLNSPGTIDPDYRGEIGVVLANLGPEPFVVHPGDRIAQAVLTPFVRARFRTVDRLPESARGGGGDGHTGR